MQKKLLFLFVPLLLLSIVLSLLWYSQNQNILTSEPEIPVKLDVYQSDEGIVLAGQTDKGCFVVVDGKTVTPDQSGHIYPTVVKRDSFDKEVIPVEVKCDDGRNLTVPLMTQYTESDDKPDYQLESIQYHAIIIGINNYDNLDKLNTPVNDAKEVAKVLKNKYGFKITLLLDKQANRDNILNTIQTVSEQLQKNDALLIYYSGHGLSDKNTKTYYWQPVNSDPKMRTQWIPTSEITNRIAGSKSSSILIISDSCYAGAWQVKGSIIPPIQASYESMLIRKHITKSRGLIASGGDEPVEDGNEGNSVFALSLLNVLIHTNKKAFTASSLYAQLLDPVVRYTVLHQTPVYHPINTALDEGGDFIFVKREKERFTKTEKPEPGFLERLDKAIKIYKKETENSSYLPTGKPAPLFIEDNPTVDPVPVVEEINIEKPTIDPLPVEEVNTEKPLKTANLSKKSTRKIVKTYMPCCPSIYSGSGSSSLAKDIYVLAMGANTHGLTQANKDAKRFAKAMRKKFRIPKKNIKILTNVSKRSFNKAIKELVKKRNKKRVYIYFSGHGTKIKGKKSGCFDEAFVFSGGYKYRVKKFVKQLNRLVTKKNKVKLVTILDTCFSGRMTRASCPRAIPKAKPFLSSCHRGMVATGIRLNGALLTASQENQMAWETPKQGGRFTKELLYYLNKVDISKKDAFRSAFRSARAKIIRETKGTGCYQRPQLFK